jgi:hypothetical protein
MVDPEELEALEQTQQGWAHSVPACVVCREGELIDDEHPGPRSQKTFQLIFSRVEAVEVSASSLEEANRKAQEFKQNNPDVTILKLTEFDPPLFEQDELDEF